MKIEPENRILLGAFFVTIGVVGLIVPLVPGIVLIGIGIKYMLPSKDKDVT